MVATPMDFFVFNLPCRGIQYGGEGIGLVWNIAMSYWPNIATFGWNPPFWENSTIVQRWRNTIWMVQLRTAIMDKTNGWVICIKIYKVHLHSSTTMVKMYTVYMCIHNIWTYPHPSWLGSVISLWDGQLDFVKRAFKYLTSIVPIFVQKVFV